MGGVLSLRDSVLEERCHRRAAAAPCAGNGPGIRRARAISGPPCHRAISAACENIADAAPLWKHMANPTCISTRLLNLASFRKLTYNRPVFLAISDAPGGATSEVTVFRMCFRFCKKDTSFAGWRLCWIAQPPIAGQVRYGVFLYRPHPGVFLLYQSISLVTSRQKFVSLYVKIFALRYCLGYHAET